MYRLKHTATAIKPSPFSYRDYKSIDQNELNMILQNCDWSQLDQVDVETKLACLGKNLMLV